MGRKAGPEQGFVDQQVPQPGETGLVEQAGLQRRSRPGEDLAERFASDPAGIGTEPRLVGVEFDPTESTRVADSPPLTMKLNDGKIRTVIWATGFRPDYSWLDVPVLDRKGRLRHDGGVVDSPGMYVLGLPFLRRRKSSLIDGAGADAADLSEHLADYLDGCNGLPVQAAG